MGTTTEVFVLKNFSCRSNHLEFVLYLSSCSIINYVSQSHRDLITVIITFAPAAPQYYHGTLLSRHGTLVHCYYVKNLLFLSNYIITCIVRFEKILKTLLFTRSVHMNGNLKVYDLARHDVMTRSLCSISVSVLY